MKTRIVFPQLWLDEKFAACKLETKLLFCYLITNLQLNLSRYLHVTDRQIMFDTGLTFNQLETGRKELSQLKWCFFTENWVYHNHQCAYVDYGGRDRVTEAKEKEIALVPDKIKEVLKGLITGYKPVLNYKQEIINNKKEDVKEETKPSPSQAKLPPTSKDALVACTDLELWEVAKGMNLSLSTVKDKHEEIMEMIESGSLQKKYPDDKKTYFILRAWLRRDKKKGYCQEMNDMERMDLLSEHPDKVKKRDELIERMKARGVL